MLTTAYYFLQVVLCSGVMMGYYWLVLRNRRFHQYNRFYLLIIALLSWLVPLIKIRWTQPVATANPPMIRFLSVVADNNSQIEQTITNKGFQWSLDNFAALIYIVIAGILLAGMFRALFRLYRLLKEHSCKNVGDVYLVITHAKGTPFSFFRYIFWNEEIDIRSEAGKQILQHELTHVQQKHSIDKLFIQVILIVGWFNPFFWLLKKEMNMIHEFIADKKAVHNGDTASLAQMLLTAAYPQQQFALTHPFFFSPIKRRLQMLTNNKNPRFSYARRLIVLPLLAIVVVLFAFRSKEQRADKTLSVASVVENVTDAISSNISSIEKISVPLLNNAIPDSNYTKMAEDEATESQIPSRATTEITASIPETVKDHLPVLVIQGMSKDELGNPARNRKIFVKDIIYQRAAVGGTKVWEETHEVTSDNHGIYSIKIGGGTKSSAITLSDIGKNDWGNGPFFINLKLAIAPSKPTAWWVATDNYIDYGTTPVTKADTSIHMSQPTFLITDSLGNVNWLPIPSAESKNVTLAANTTTLVTVHAPGFKKGDALLVTKLVEQLDWSVYSAWVAEDNKVRIRFINAKDKPVFVLGTQYKIVAPNKAAMMQNKDGAAQTNVVGIKDEVLPDKLFTQVQTPPEFPGGRPAWLKYLERNLNRDIVVEKGAPPGKYTVWVSFVVDKDGTVSNIKAETNPGYGSKEEAIRMIAKGPKWKPAMQNGENITSVHKQSITWVVSEPDMYIKQDAISLNNSVNNLTPGVRKKTAQEKAYEMKLTKAKTNNLKSFFTIDGKSCVVTAKGSWAEIAGTTDIVIVNGKRMTPAELNNQYKRSDFVMVAASATGETIDKYGKGVLLVSSTPLTNAEIKKLLE